MKFNPNVLDCAAAPIAEAWSWVKDRDSERLIDMCQAVPAHLPPQSLLRGVDRRVIRPAERAGDLRVAVGGELASQVGHERPSEHDAPVA